MEPCGAKEIHVLLADGHEIARIGLRTILSSQGIEVVGECGTAVAAVSIALRLKPHVVLMDVCLPDRSGIEACMEIRKSVAGVRVLLLSNSDHRETALASAFAGADRYLLKSIEAESLTRIVRTVAARPSSVLEELHPLPNFGSIASDPLTTQSIDHPLSRQESRILALVAEGKTNKQIAAALQLSDKTVKNYLSNVFGKLNINRRSEAAAIFARRTLQ